MAFTGFSSDEEGSIVFDGEQFIINNPDNVPPDFDPGDRPVIYTRPPVVPSTPVPPPTAPVQQSQPESTSESTQSSQTFRLGERILRRNRERARQDAATQSKAPSLQVIDEVPDFADLGFIDSEPLPVSEAPDWPGSTPLSQGQSLHVDHLLSTETDTLAREVLIGIRREGIPPEALLYDFMSQYAEWGWDDLSSAWAVQVLNMIRQSDWDKVFAHADSTPVETIAQDLGNNTREGLVIIDAGSGNVVLNKTGVRGPGGQQYVGLQDYEVEALRGLDLIFVHNHTNDTGASKDDLLSAFDAGAKLLIVITQSGREQVYIRGRYGMVEVRDAKASYKVGSPTLDETIALANKSAEQAAAYREDPPELIFRQDVTDPMIEVSGTLFAFGNHQSALTLKGRFTAYNFSSTNPQKFRILGKSPLNHSVVLIEVLNPILYTVYRLWINLEVDSTKYSMVGVDLESIPTLYVRLPIVVDEKAFGGTLDIELSDDEWADRTGEDDDPTTQRGMLSRDYNHFYTGYNLKELAEPFQLQSPVIGPDVRVEFVVRGDEELGNYVVISFPASVYQSNDMIMHHLKMQSWAAERLRTERPDMEHFANVADHKPDRWNEDGRIFYAFAHLSEIDPDIQPGKFIASRDMVKIGKTGKSGTSQHHLDLVIMYFGSSKTGSGAMETELNILRSEYKRTGSNSVAYFFGLAERSQLYPTNNRSDVYAENLDSVRLHPELDESGIAEYMEGYSIYAQ